MSEQPHEMVTRLERMGQQKQPHTRHMEVIDKFGGEPVKLKDICPVCDDECYCGSDDTTKRRWKAYYEGYDWRRVEE